MRKAAPSRGARQGLICAALAGALGLAACTQFPDVEAATSDAARAAEYPSLVPTAAFDDAPRTGRLVPEDGPRLLSRAERLRQRGAILRGLPTVDEATRIRISDRLRSLGG